MVTRTQQILAAPDGLALQEVLRQIRRDIERLQHPNGVLLAGKWAIEIDASEQLVATWVATGAQTVIATP